MTTNTSYNIDNTSLKFSTWGQEATDKFQQLVFQSEPLALGSVRHTLTITNLVNDGKFILDFINITSAATTTATTAYTAPSTAVSGNSPAKHVPVGTIVGAVLLGTFAVVVIIAGIIFLKRKKQSKCQQVNARFPHATGE